MCGFLILFLLFSSAVGSGRHSMFGKEIVELQRSSATFSNKIFHAVRELQPKGDLGVSPATFMLLLGIMRAGARGGTAQRLDTILGYDGDSADFLQDFANLANYFDNFNSEAMKMSRKLYISDKYQIDSTYQDLLKSYFRTPIETLPFYLASFEAMDEINRWSTEASNGHFHNMLTPVGMRSSMRALLVSTFYMDAVFKNQFEVAQTKPEKFYVSENSSVLVDMMRTTGKYPYAFIKELDASAVSLPYLGGDLSLVVLVPRLRTGLKTLEEHLFRFAIALADIPSRMAENEVEVFLPRCSFESNIDLISTGILRRLGYPTAGGDYTSVTEETSLLPDIDFDGVIQRVKFDINERGSLPYPSSDYALRGRPYVEPRHIVVLADRPFLTFVYDAQTRAIPFLFRKTK